jgi:hypothetical protein
MRNEYHSDVMRKEEAGDAYDREKQAYQQERQAERAALPLGEWQLGQPVGGMASVRRHEMEQRVRCLELALDYHRMIEPHTPTMTVAAVLSTASAFYGFLQGEFYGFLKGEGSL